MDALVIVCSRNTNVIMVWAWMLWSTYVLGTRPLLWLGHGCSGYRMLAKHERYYGLGMDAPVLERSRASKNAIRGIRNILGPWNPSTVWIVPRRPHPERSAKYAFFARLRSGGANNNSSNNNSNHSNDSKNSTDRNDSNNSNSIEPREGCGWRFPRSFREGRRL